MQLVSKISNLCDPDPPTLQTDGQTDGRHAISIPRYALVHRAVKTSVMPDYNYGGVVVFAVSALASINVDNRHWARLLLGWVTACGQVNRLGM